MAETRETIAAKSRRTISAADILAALPQGSLFRFVDRILELDATHVVARYRFRPDEFFYYGHFPERPVTPGVILLEAMAQCGLTVQGLFLLGQEIGMEEARHYRVLFSGAEVEWFDLVLPGDEIVLRSELVAWRMRRIRSRVKLFSEAGALKAESMVSGMSVLWTPGEQPARTPAITSEGAKEFVGQGGSPDES